MQFAKLPVGNLLKKGKKLFSVGAFVESVEYDVCVIEACQDVQKGFFEVSGVRLSLTILVLRVDRSQYI
jgi:hypothetical protein